MIEIKNLYKSFGGDEVLKDIRLNVKRGQVLGIIGPSGSGKSTLLRCINNLELPTKGTIHINGKLAYQDESGKVFSETEISITRTKVGMVFQHFNLFPHMTVLENVYAGPKFVLGQDEKEYRSEALAILENKVNKYKELFKELKNHPKIQLVEFECEYFKNNRNDKDTDFHINLFGTFIRFLPIFEPSKKMEYYVSID